MSEPVGDTLYNLIKRQEYPERADPRLWEQVLDRVRSHPEEARFLAGNYLCPPLVIACRSDVPLDVFNALYEAAPEHLYYGLRFSDGTFVDCREPVPALTILHHAVYNSSFKIIERILEIHLPMAFKVDHDRHGYTPFEGLIRYRIPEAVDPDFVPSPFFHYGTPWETACLLLKVLYYNTIEDELPDGKQWRVLHVAVACTKHLKSRGFKMELVQLAIQKHPEQLSERDEDGDLPLHIACTVNGLSSDGHINAIKMLLEAYPEAATMRNAHGDLPLHLALRNGKRMGVRELAQANMDALMEPDTQTSLFPFQAASASRRRKEDLSITYELLRGCPQLHSFGNWATQGILEKKKSGSKKRKATSKGSSSKGKKKK